MRDIKELHQAFQEHNASLEKAMENGKKFGMTVSGAGEMNVLTLFLLHFWGDISTAELQVDDKELAFFSTIIGDTVTYGNLVSLAKNDSLKPTTLFQITSFYDIYVHIFERHIGQPPTEDFFGFFELLGSEYLDRFGTSNRIKKYNQRMQSLLDDIIERDKEHKLHIRFLPYGSRKENNAVKRTNAVPQNVDINQYLKDPRDNFRTCISELRGSYLQTLELVQTAVSLATKLIPDKFDIQASELLQTSLLYFFSQMSIVDNTTKDDEITFLMGILGCPINREIIESCSTQKILKTYMFELLCAFDNAAKMMSQNPIKSSAAKVVHNYVEICGKAYLSFFSFPLGRVKAYDLYMKDITDLINEKNKALDSPITVEPYSSPAIELYEGIRDKLASKLLHEHHNLDETHEEKNSKRSVEGLNERAASGSLDINNTLTVVPIAERVEHAHPTKNGLYPHEILLLYYSDRFHNQMQNVPRKWYERYGVADVISVLESLKERGFLVSAGIDSTLNKHTAEELKAFLRNRGLSVSGSKQSLVSRLIQNVPEKDIVERYPERYYALTILGKQEVDNNLYLVFVDRQYLYDFDIWAANSMLGGREGKDFPEIYEEYVKTVLSDSIKQGRYDKYIQIMPFAIKLNISNKDYGKALRKVAHMIYIGFNGARGPASYYSVDFRLRSLVPYENSQSRLTTEQIAVITTIKHELHLTNESLKDCLSKWDDCLQLKYEIVTRDECAQIAVYTLSSNYLEINKIYEQAKERMYQKYPSLTGYRVSEVKQKKDSDLALLNETFETLKDSYDYEHKDALLNTIREVSKINPIQAISMWKYLLKNNTEELHRDYSYLASSFIEAVIEGWDEEKAYSYIIDDNELCRYLYSETHCISNQAMKIIKWAIISGEEEKARMVLALIDENKNKTQKMSEILDFIIPGQRISFDMLEMLTSQVQRVTDKKDRLPLEVKLMQLRKHIESKDSEKNEHLDTLIQNMRDKGLPVYRKDIFGNEYKPYDNRSDGASVTSTKDETAKEELNSLIGLQSIKQDVMNLLALVKTMKMREARGLKAIPVSLHLVFTGNPGTGKTTVARILAQLYKEIGVLKTGQLIEVDRSDLVAGYVGQTAIKTQEKIAEARGGILFIDEAYTLAKEGNDFGQEAIDTILKEMEDHRGEFVVIVAGYTEPMKKFIESNPGLKSRFNKFFEFPDYNAVELNEIFTAMCNKYDFTLTDDAREVAVKKIEEMENRKEANFANARDVRNYFEKIITKQASRVASMENTTDEQLTTITLEDVSL